MKGYSRVIKCVAAIILILIPALSLAQPFPSSPLWDMFQNLTFTPPTNDMSVAFLARMFGAVPGVAQLASGGTTILGTVFGVFNAAILALSGVFLSYTITKIVTETTMDGSAMGKGTTIWTAVRCALSTSLLVPQASGYSMINGIVMWVVIQGVGLADITWSRAMDYLKAGGTTYAMPTSRVDYSLINWDVTTGNKNIDKSNLPVSVGSADVLRSLVCAYSVRGALVKSQSITYQNLMDKQAKGISLTLAEQTQLANASKTIPEKGEVFSVYKKFESKCVPATVCTNPNPKKLPKCCPNCCSDYTGGAFQFPYVKDEATNPLKGYGLNIRDSSIPVLTGVCGTISYSIGQKGSKESVDAYTERGNRYIPAKLRGLEDMIGTLEPTAKNLIDQIRAVVPPPPVNKTQPNPDTYVIYNDGSDKGFFIKPNAAISTKYKLGSSDKGGNLTVYVTFPKNTYDNLPTINWPLGSDEILSAAAAYQVALADAQTIGRNISAENASKAFSDAKKNGWIGAGGYYRLLATIQNSAKMEYNNYRLTGYVGLDQPFAKPSDLANRGNIPWYMVLFSAATPLAAGRPTPIAAIDSSYQKTMSDALTWIFLSYPYSVLHGKALAYSLSKTATTGNIGALAPNLDGPSEVGIYAKLVTGSIFLALLPPVAIPFLIDIPMDWLKLDVNNVFAEWKEDMDPGSIEDPETRAEKLTADPILKLQNLGKVMMEQSMAYIDQLKGFFLAVSLSVSGAQLIYSIVSASVAAGSFWGTLSGVQDVITAMVLLLNGALQITQTVIFMYLPIGLAVLTPMFISGMMFAIYVPLIPYMLFLFGVISWFISVLVLMAAAPIICFLMLWGNSSQENPLLAKEAEQFMMQLIGVFFRPALMIIGLITGMVLSYIGVDVLNLGFSNIVASIIDTTKDTGDILLIKQVGVVVIYTFTMVTLVNMCFSTIYLLYSEAMRIAGIGAPAVGMEAAQLEAVKAATTQVAEAGVGGMKEGAVAMKGASATFGGLEKFKRAKKPAGAEGGGVDLPK